MAQGQKFDDRVREKAIALLATNMTAAEVAKRTGASETTVRNWKKQYLEDDPQALAKLRVQKRAVFAANAWSDIEKAQGMLSRRLDRAEAQEDALDKLIALVSEADVMTLTREEKRELIRMLQMIKLEDPAKLTNIIGVLYDKQALASDESTVNLGGTVGVKNLEDT
ncbi:MAG: helix-turn-helix domain-containing protein [Clostridia bacterium]|nr:helix-turn-helix domain-containing protein [Clostridia bacterium]